MYYYSLTRTLDEADNYSTTVSVSDRDPINCAHMLAAGFNTISRNSTLDFVLGVVDTKTGTVYYDGKHEQIDRPKPDVFEAKFRIDPSSVDPDTLITLFGEDNREVFSAFGKVTVEESGPYEPQPKYAHLSRGVLEDAYTEIGLVNRILSDAGVETIPASSGVREMKHEIDRLRTENAELKRRDEFEHYARTTLEHAHAEQNVFARDEMISFVKRAHAKKQRLQTAVPDGDGRSDLDHRWRGMLDVLAKFLVITGEADKDEGHAVARRLCEIDEEMS